MSRKIFNGGAVALGADGRDGKDGKNGVDGISPTVELSTENGVTTMTVTDAEGTHSAQIMDGADGQNGADGVSPVVELSRDDALKCVTVTVTDAEGVKTAQIFDGANGTDGKNGVSPIASFVRGDGKTILTITDAEGEKTAEIHDGATGQKGDQGETGYPPKLSDTGTWMVWDAEGGAYIDTFVKAFYGDSLPEVGVEDAGKVLTVTDAGMPGWMQPSQGDWKTLVDVTTEEDASAFRFTFDDVSELIIMISGTATHARVNFFSDGITNFYHYTFLRASKKASNYLHIHKRIGGMRYMESGWVSDDTPETGLAYALIGSSAYGMIVRSVKDSINDLRFDCNGSYILQSGARIQIFGR